jgi:hypothetical protein
MQVLNMLLNVADEHHSQLEALQLCKKGSSRRQQERTKGRAGYVSCRRRAS